MSLTPQFLDELRSRITLSGVISRTTRLTKAGHEWKACCPFHEEKSPSFTVNDQKGFYHCFGCGAHGDAIRWMTDQRGLSFMDAVKELAAEAGMELPAPDPRAAMVAKRNDTLYDVMDAAQAWFVEMLSSPEGAQARAYLGTRGFDVQVIEKFGFGFAPDNRQALPRALARFDEAMLIEAGLRITAEGKDTYDRFRNRLMLPIQDARGRVIAFGGRILDAGKSDAPKYLNSPDTPLFDKGRTLYNLHRAGPASRKSGRIVVVEGYMDVVALASAGIEEAVAPLGTALTESQIELLWRHTETPIVCFDGDAAGQRAARRAIARVLPMLRPSHSLKIVNLPPEMDPDDIVKRAGVAGMELLLDEGLSLLEALWWHERNASPLETPEEKVGLKDRISKHIETIIDPDIRSIYRQELFREFAKFAYRRDDWSVQSSKAETGDLARRNKLKAIYHADSEHFFSYMHRRLGAAIALAFTIWPDEIYKYAEDLSKIKDLDPRIDVMIDAVHELNIVNESTFLMVIDQHRLPIPNPKEFDYMRFPFAWKFSDREDALESLKFAVQFYATMREARRELELAQARYERNFDIASEAEKNRILYIFRDIVQSAKYWTLSIAEATPDMVADEA